MSKYCNRWIDNYPSVRGECARHLARGLPCEDCSNRNIHQEVRDLREALKLIYETTPDEKIRNRK